MWDRTVIKARAKEAYRANRWSCVLVALVLTFMLGGGLSGNSGGVSVSRLLNNNSQNSYDYFDDYDIYDDFNEYDDIDNLPIIDDFEDQLENLPWGGDLGGGIDIDMLLTIIFAVFAVYMLIVILVKVFASNPLEVGCRKFFADNFSGGADVGTMAYGFKNSYLNIVKVQFIRGLFVTLWSLLLIVPGIIKDLEYMMVPYLLSEDPNMDYKTALETSSQMMYGHKADAFILRLSFLGWNMLSVFTLGILNIIFTNPYQYASEAELYRVLSGQVSGMDDGTDYTGGYKAEYNTIKEDDVYITFEEPEVWD